MNEQSKQDFIKQLTLLQSINLPQVAKDMGLDWFNELKPEIDKDCKFKSAIEEYLERCRYEMLQKVFTVGMNGKTAGYGKSPEMSYIKEVIKFIDSGVILGKVKEEEEHSESGASLIQLVTGNCNLEEQK